MRRYHFFLILLGLHCLMWMGCPSSKQQQLTVSNPDQAPMSASPQPLRSDTTGLKPTDELMPLDQYWEIVALSRKATHGDEQQANWLEDYLATNLKPMDIVRFEQRTDQLVNDIYTSEMWCAAYLLGGGCSDDCFQYFCWWLVSQGKELYESAKANPDNHANHTTPYSGMVGEENEPFGYAAGHAFSAVTGLEIYDYCTAEISYTDLELTWNENEPETMRRICPNICKKLGK